MYNCEMKQQWCGGNCHDERCENVENVSAGVVQSSATGVLAGWLGLGDCNKVQLHLHSHDQPRPAAPAREGAHSNL